MAQRRTLKELLIEAKDIAELMVDLSYAALFFDDERIANEVLQLEETMGNVIDELRRISVLAARSPEDAEAMAGVLGLASAMEKIGDAAEDIARIVLKSLGVPPELRDDLRHADEIVARVRVREENQIEGKTLADIHLPRETGMWVIAIRRDVQWIFDPDADEVVHADDVLFLQGPQDGVDLVRELAGAPPRHLREPAQRTLTGLDRAVDLLIEMKNASEVAVGLAYSAILFRDKGLAAEVSAIEDSTDEMHHELERWALRAVREVDDPDELRGLLHLASASERIADAAQEMTRLVEDEEEPHPVISEALAETDEIVSDATVAEGSAAAGKSLRALSVRTETGMDVLAIQRRDRWIYRPRGGFSLQPGDRVIAVGPEEGAAELETLCQPETELVREA